MAKLRIANELSSWAVAVLRKQWSTVWSWSKSTSFCDKTSLSHRGQSSLCILRIQIDSLPSRINRFHIFRCIYCFIKKRSYSEILIEFSGLFHCSVINVLCCFSQKQLVYLNTFKSFCQQVFQLFSWHFDLSITDERILISASFSFMGCRWRLDYSNTRKKGCQ